jgi:hypothetical protein
MEPGLRIAHAKACFSRSFDALSSISMDFFEAHLARLFRLASVIQRQYSLRCV